MLTLHGVAYTHPNRDLLFSEINLIINKHDKVALIGNNGAGKSTLLKILAGELAPSGGVVRAETMPYYLPQLFGQFNDYRVAQALRVEDKLRALHEILDDRATEANLLLLADDWSIEERCREALAHWQLGDIDLTQSIQTLSGGQKTRVFLAGIFIHRPAIVLLDEPSNHLDTAGRSILYDYIKSTRDTLVVVSHDRMLLNMLNTVCELDNRGITVYGGNYDFYAEQKLIEADALHQDVKSQEKALRKAREMARASLERQQKLDARGQKKQEKAGLPTIMMKTFKNSAERSTSRMKGVHADKVEALSQSLGDLRKALPAMDKMKMGLDNSALHKGKVLITARNVNFEYGDGLLWKTGLNFQIASGERIVIKGINGSGKTTLVKLMLGDLVPRSGMIDRAGVKALYIDQDYSLVDNTLCVYEQAQRYNSGGLQEHEIKIRLNRFLFTKEDWDKPCSELSGGEKMRLMLCSLTIGSQAPDLIVLDEPTNNLDIQNVAILTAAINEYAGTLLVISHDEYFLEQIHAEGSIVLAE